MSGDSLAGQGALFQQGDGGSSPTSPLQPKQLIVRVISRGEARSIWIHKHYLHRDFAGASVEFGVFSPDNLLVGALGFSARLGGSKKGGAKEWMELRRFWLDDACQKNSESRVLMYCIRWIKKHCPQIKCIISYSDHTKMKHKGTIYKACGFIRVGETGGSSWLSNPSHKTADNWSKTRWVKSFLR